MADRITTQDLFKVKGLVAVVTGGGTGLGLCIARTLDANGAKAVYIIGRRQDILQQAADQSSNGTIKPIAADVTDKSSLLQAARRIEQEEGFINLLFANSGVAGPDQVKLTQKPDGEKLSVKEFQQAMLSRPMNEFTDVLNVNTTGAFMTAMAFLDLLDKGNQYQALTQASQIIITSSMAGFCRLPGLSFAYNVSKSAVTHLGKMMASTFAQRGFNIRVNVIAPGMFPCGTSAPHIGNMKPYENVKGAFEMPICPVGRTGSDTDMAGLVLFLASQAGAYLNGATILTVSDCCHPLVEEIYD